MGFFLVLAQTFVIRERKEKKKSKAADGK